MSLPKIVVINQSTVVENSEIETFVAALNTQVREHFQPIWKQGAAIEFASKAETPDPEAWQLVVLDDTDQAGALGYHDTTASNMPLGKAFAKTCQQYGTSLTVDLSHEALEMLGDPQINSVVTLFDGSGEQWLAALETCDAVEDDQYAYEVDGVLLSNFVYPSWFDQRPNDPDVPAGQLDHQGVLTMSLAQAVTAGSPKQALAPGGYIGLQNPQGSWSQVIQQENASHADALVLTRSNADGGRYDRRFKGRKKFRASQR